MEIARELDDPALLVRTLSACGFIAGARYHAETAASYYSEAIDVARALDDRWKLSQLLAWQANTGISTGDPMAAGRAGRKDALSLTRSVTERMHGTVGSELAGHFYCRAT